MGKRASAKEIDERDTARMIEDAHKERQKLTGKTEFEFEIGVIAASEKVLDQMEPTKKLLLERNKMPGGSFSNFMWDSFARHCVCDWGDISQEDRKANNRALKTGGQLFSTYKHTEYPTICILTEDDRSQTGIGLESEFDLA